MISCAFCSVHILFPSIVKHFFELIFSPCLKASKVIKSADLLKASSGLVYKLKNRIPRVSGKNSTSISISLPAVISPQAAEPKNAARLIGYTFGNRFNIIHGKIPLASIKVILSKRNNKFHLNKNLIIICTKNWYHAFQFYCISS